MKYDDIINTKWPVISSRDPMPLNQRAKIFLPFSALTGYEQSLDKTLQIAIKDMEQKTGYIQFEDFENLLED